jgi:shikimate dehydrogenase
MSARLAVFGHPIAHSRSPLIHRAFGAQTGVDLSYEAIDAPPEQFVDRLADFWSEDGIGANVTLPLKGMAAMQCASLSDRAQRAGAVNTLKRLSLGWHGDNTDGLGLLDDLDRLGLDIAGARILVLGAGGATRGILAPLLARAPAQLAIANRTFEAAQHLAAQFHALGSVHAVDANERGPFDLVIHASAAFHGAGEFAFATACFAAADVVDLSYGAAHQALRSIAEHAGARSVHDGLGMLVGQAARAFEIWFGVRPDPWPVLNELRAGRLV